MITLILATWGIGKLLYDFYIRYDPNLLLLGLSFVVLLVIYIILLFLLKFITKEELEQIPFYKDGFDNFSKKSSTFYGTRI